jgi:release factor glutamine methyltransferase
LKNYIHDTTETIIVLCEGCEIKMIKDMAEMSGFKLHLKLTKQGLMEKSYIYKIELDCDKM